MTENTANAASTASDVNAATVQIPHDVKLWVVPSTMVDSWDLGKIIAAELQRLVDRAFPDGDDSDYHYGCEALFDLTIDRIRELRGESGS
jgi:hypothetical protein